MPHDSHLFYVTHISDDDLERYYLGMLRAREMIRVENHLFWCEKCISRAYEAQDYVDSMRAAIIQGDFDLEWLEGRTSRRRAHSEPIERKTREFD